MPLHLSNQLLRVLLSLVSAGLVCYSQALQRHDVTLGATADSGLRSNAMSRGYSVGGEITYSLTDRFYLHGAGGRFSGSLDRSSPKVSTTNVYHFSEVALGTQFRLQQSLSPFVDVGLAGLWGSGVETFSNSSSPNSLEFDQIAFRAGGGIRYVQKPTSRWGVALFYRFYVPLHTSSSIATPLFLLRADEIHDRAGATLFVRF